MNTSALKTFAPATSLRPDCKLAFIATEADLDQWLAALREAALTEMNNGHRIIL